MIRVRNIIFVVSAILYSSSSQAAAPDGRYTVTGGNIVDTTTGLTWQQKHVANVTQPDAVKYCSSQPGGWRLPTVKELFTLYDLAASATESETVFLDSAFQSVSFADAFFWSATMSAADPLGAAWEVFFGNWTFNVTTSAISADYKGSVRCVR